MTAEEISRQRNRMFRAAARRLFPYVKFDTHPALQHVEDGCFVEGLVWVPNSEERTQEQLDAAEKEHAAWIKRLCDIAGVEKTEQLEGRLQELLVIADVKKAEQLEGRLQELLVDPL